MHAYSNPATRLLQPRVSVARWNWRKRRFRSRLRGFGLPAVSGMAGIWIDLIMALHESRRRSAARVIHRHRHLIDHACQETRRAEAMEQ